MKTPADRLQEAYQQAEQDRYREQQERQKNWVFGILLFVVFWFGVFYPPAWILFFIVLFARVFV